MPSSRRLALLIAVAVLAAGAAFLAFRPAPDELAFASDDARRRTLTAAVLKDLKPADVDAARRHADWAAFEAFLSRPTERVYLRLLASGFPLWAKHRVAGSLRDEGLRLKDRGMRRLGELTWQTHTFSGLAKPTPLLKRLDSRDPELRRLAALALVDMKDYSKASHARLERLRDEADPVVRDAARRALEILDRPPP